MFRTLFTRSFRLHNKATLPFRPGNLFHTTTPVKQNYFDTFKFVERLEKQGFTTEQSEVIMLSLQKVITENMQNLTKIMVSKAEREKVNLTSASFCKSGKTHIL